MRLHIVQALTILALQLTITSTAPTDSAIKAESDLIARDTSSTNCWSDGYGEVANGSFSFIMDHEHGCTMTLQTQGNPQQGIVYKLNANGTIACGNSIPPKTRLLRKHSSSVILVVARPDRENADDEFPVQTRPSRGSSRLL